MTGRNSRLCRAKERECLQGTEASTKTQARYVGSIFLLRQQSEGTMNHCPFHRNQETKYLGGQKLRVVATYPQNYQS